MTPHVLCIALQSDRAQSEAFIGLKEAGVKLEVMTRSTSPFFQKLIQSGIKVIPHDLKNRFDVAGMRRIRSLIQERKYNLLHLFDNKSICNGIWASVGLPVKIVTYRGAIGNIGLWDPASWLTHLNPRVTRIVCNSRAVSQYFLNLSGSGYRVPPEKIVTIYKGHDPEWYQVNPSNLEDFGIPPDAFTVACVANYRYNKGTHLLVEATRWILKNENIHFLLVGEMKDKRLLHMISSSQWRDRIHLAGFRKDALELIAACDTVVQPSLWRESFPRSVVEAMAMGIAPIVSSVGGNPELVENNMSGLVFQQGNAKQLAERIIELKTDPERRRSMGVLAKRRIEEVFNVRTTVEETLSLYRDLTSTHKEKMA